MPRSAVKQPGPSDASPSRGRPCRVSITMESDFRVGALSEAVARQGPPEIMNTDPVSQFTGAEFIGELAKHHIVISMDGRGQWRDNLFVTRLWKSVKYEEVHLEAYDSVSAARAGIAAYLAFNNRRRPHTAHGGQPPDMVYFDALPQKRAAACASNTGCPPRRSCVRRKRRPPAAVDNPASKHFDPQPIH